MSNQVTTEEWVKRQAAKQQSDYAALMKLVQQFLPIVVAIGGLGFIFAAAGFLVVNTSLGWFTDLQLYSVNPNQYIAAGIILFIFTISIIVPPHFIRNYLKSKNLNKIIRFILFTLASAFFTILWILVYYALTANQLGTDVRHIAVLILGSIALLVVYLMSHFVADLSDTFGLVLLSILACTIIYAGIPRDLGGGRPASIQIVFDDSDSLTQVGLPVSNDADNVSQTVCLLAELNDGLLIYVPSDLQGGQYTVTVPQKMIVSLRDTQEVIDCSSPKWANPLLPSPTPAAPAQASPSP